MLGQLVGAIHNLLRKTEKPERIVRSGFDRRVNTDRRVSIHLEYLLHSPERRKCERRIRAKDRRAGWQRVYRWNSFSNAEMGFVGRVMDGQKVYFL